MRPVRILLYGLIAGLLPTVAAAGTGHFAQWWLSGFVLAMAFVPVALFGPRGFLRQALVIVPPLLAITVFCLWSEALLFMQTPQYQQQQWRNLLEPAGMFFVFALVLAGLPSLLKLSRPDSAIVEHRRGAGLWMTVPLCGLAYALYYFVFGAITYRYFTRQYYPEAAQMAAGLGLTFWAIQIARGMLMTASLIPIITTLRMSRAQAALAAGMILWVAGGLAPLLTPGLPMLPVQRFIHMVEILTQNLPLGITAVLLVRNHASPRLATHAAAHS